MQLLNKAILLILFVFGLTTSPLSAQAIYTWNGNTGDWQVDANWTPNGIPANGDTAVIPNGQVNISGEVTVAVLKMSAGDIGGNGILNITDQLEWLGGRMNDAGSTVIANNAQVIINAPGIIGLSDSRQFVNSGIIHWQSGRISNDDDVNFTNNNIINLNGGSLFSRSFIGGTFTNVPGGNINVNQGPDSEINATFNNNGTVSVLQGALKISGPGNDSGIYNISGNNSLLFYSASRTLALISIVNSSAGTVEFNSTANVVILGGYNVHKTEVRNATVSFQNEVLFPTLEVYAGELNGSADLAVQELFRWSGGRIGGSGILTLLEASTAEFNTTGSLRLDDERIIINNTEVDWNGGGIFSDGTNSFENNGTIHINGNDLFNRSFNNGQLTNTPSGKILITQNGDSKIDAFFNNNGTVLVEKGRLIVDGNGTDSGLYQLQGNTTLEFRSDQRSLTPASFIDGPAATVVFAAAGHTSIAGGYNAGTTETTTATVTFNIDVVFPKLHVLGGEITGAANHTITEFLNWRSGEISGSGTVTLTANANGLFDGSASRRLTEDRQFVNEGIIQWDGGLIDCDDSNIFRNQGILNVNGSSDFNRTFSDGILNNDSDAYIHLTTNGLTKFTGVFNNHGLLNTSEGSLRLSGGGTDSGEYRTGENGHVHFSGTGRALIQNSLLSGHGSFQFSTNGVANAATISPGLSTGTLTIDSPLPSTASSEVAIEIGGYTPGSKYDRIVVNGNAPLNGKLSVRFVDGFTPAAGDTFRILSATSTSGSFSTIDNPNGTSLDVEYENNGIFVRVAGSNNRTPVAVNDTTEISEDIGEVFSVTENDSDFENDPLTVAISQLPQHGEVMIVADTAIFYQPETNYFGADSFQYRLYDINGNSDDAYVFLSIHPVPDPPTPANLLAPDDSSAFGEITPTLFTWHHAADPDGDLLNYTIHFGSDDTDTSFAVGPDTSIIIDGTTVFQLYEHYQWTVTTSDGQFTTGTDTFTFIFDGSPAFTTVPSNLPDIRGDAKWGDYDGDGDLDLALLGLTAEGDPVTQIYENNNGVFNSLNTDLIQLSNGNVSWADYDNDGDLDLLMVGYNNTSFNFATQIYRNDEGIFNAIEDNLPDMVEAEAAWADYDNDGDKDLILSGNRSFENNPLTRIFVNDFFANPTSPFAERSNGLPDVRNAALDWADFDNDGDLDLAIAGRDSLSPFVGTARIFRNDNGYFVDIRANLTGVLSPGIRWGDFDNDGDPDLFLSGNRDSLTVNIEANPAVVSKIYRNDQGIFTDINAALPGVTFIDAAWGDYDNDGDLDLLLTGYSEEEEGQSELINKLFLNDNGDFNERRNSGFESPLANSLDWGDFDNDGDLDILSTGASPNGGHRTWIYENQSTNSNNRPSAPVLVDAIYNDGEAQINWEFGNDNETPLKGLSYNLRVGTTPGQGDVVSPQSGFTGLLQIPAFGNVRQNTSWSLKHLLPGTYYWTVQTVDNGYAGSIFAQEKSFEVRQALRQIRRENLGRVIEPSSVICDTLSVFFTPPVEANKWFIQDLSVSIDSLFHTDVRDLEIFLIHNNIVDTLVIDLQNAGENFIGTVFDDSAATAIQNASAPFTGHFRPIQPLSRYLNEEPQGDWCLQIRNKSVTASARLEAWSLALTFGPLSTSLNEEANNLPSEFALSQNFPNPFNPETNIRFALPKPATVQLDVFNVLGQWVSSVVKKRFEAGYHIVHFNGNRLPSGVYFYRLNAGEFVRTRKMLLIK